MSCSVEDFKYIINVCAKCLGEGGREGGRGVILFFALETGIETGWMGSRARRLT